MARTDEIATEATVDEQVVLQQAQTLLEQTEEGVQKASKVATQRLHDAAAILRGRHPRRWRQITTAWLAGFVSGVTFSFVMIRRARQSARERRQHL